MNNKIKEWSPVTPKTFSQKHIFSRLITLIIPAGLVFGCAHTVIYNSKPVRPNDQIVNPSVASCDGFDFCQNDTIEIQMIVQYYPPFAEGCKFHFKQKDGKWFGADSFSMNSKIPIDSIYSSLIHPWVDTGSVVFDGSYVRASAIHLKNRAVISTDRNLFKEEWGSYFSCEQ